MVVGILKGISYPFLKHQIMKYAFGNNKHSHLRIETEDDYLVTPIRVLEDNGDIWYLNINKVNQQD